MGSAARFDEVPVSTVPIKLRNPKPTAVELYKQIMMRQDFGPVLHTLVQRNHATTEVEALELVKAWIQWLCIGATTRTENYLMFHGPVDEAFHSAILCTRWYMNFCTAHIGCYVHHDPLDKNSFDDATLDTAIAHTIMLLENVWGEQLEPGLKVWVEARNRGELTPTSVSCVCNGHDD